MTEPSSNKSHSLASEVRALTGLNAAKCYQCGKCSAGCPMAAEMKQKPHDILRLVLNDRREQLFADESMWLCLTCETCTERCPNGCDPARIIDGVREVALKSTCDAPKAISSFHESFLKQIRAYGRLFELGLIINYKLRGGPMFQDALAAPGMMARGKLSFAAHTIKGVKDVRRIFKACEAARKEDT
jgi:heterodisulfide reductase subunit C